MITRVFLSDTTMIFHVVNKKNESTEVLSADFI